MKSVFPQIAAVINEALERHFPVAASVDVIAEPGRFFVASSQTLAYRVHTKRDIYHDGKLAHSMYFLIDGSYGGLSTADPKVFRPITMKPPTEGMNKHATLVQITIIPFNSIEIIFVHVEEYPSSIWGPTCDSADCVSAIYFSWRSLLHRTNQ